MNIKIRSDNKFSHYTPTLSLSVRHSPLPGLGGRDCGGVEHGCKQTCGSPKLNIVDLLPGPIAFVLGSAILVTLADASKVSCQFSLCILVLVRDHFPSGLETRGKTRS